MKHEIGDIFYTTERDRMGWYTGERIVWEDELVFVFPFDGLGVA